MFAVSSPDLSPLSSRAGTYAALALALTAGCGGAGVAEGFGQGASLGPPPAGTPDPAALRLLGPGPGGVTPECDAAATALEERLEEALGRHLGTPPDSVVLPLVAGAAAGRPGRLSIAVTRDAVRFHGWSFRPTEMADVGRALEGELRAAKLMTAEGAPDVRAIDLWVDASAPVVVLHDLLATIPEALEPRMVVRVMPGDARPEVAPPPWVDELAGRLSSSDVASREEALAEGLARAAPSCEAVTEARVATKLQSWNERDAFFARSLAQALRICGCEGVDLEAAAALVLLAAGATGEPTGVFGLGRKGASLPQPREGSVGDFAKALAARPSNEWRAPVALELTAR